MPGRLPAPYLSACISAYLLNCWMASFCISSDDMHGMPYGALLKGCMQHGTTSMDGFMKVESNNVWLMCGTGTRSTLGSTNNQ
ncbi:hypothetical protein F4782DRAFT_490049 [Xylaria castorea]|nr:hypothetical protein F4782DRAFT_490049 [Xylaria castorea]